MTWALTLLAVTVGAALQRITGLGFVLVSGSLLVLVLGPFDGILLANILSAVIALFVLLRTYADTDWRVVRRLLLGLIVGVPIGIVVVRLLDPRFLLITVGGLTVLAVVLALLRRPMPFLSHPTGAILAGSVSAFSNVTAGVGGPALAIYGAATAMPMRVFIPTAQAVAFVMNIASTAVKLPFALPIPLVLGSLGCVALGLGAGSLLRHVVTAHAAQRIALGLALFGALAATAQGITQVV